MSDAALCLVLGANGFIGSHLVDELVASGYRVRAFDRYDGPPQFNVSDKVEVFKGDIYDEATLERSLEGVTYVIHSFSATTPASSDNDPLTDVDRNLRPSVTIFEHCVQKSVKKIVFLSSGGAIYGHIAEEKPAAEDDVPTPVSPYGIVKLATEGYLAYFNRKFDADYIVYRLSNPYGPRQIVNKNQGVIPAFLSQIKEDGHIKVLGDGTTTRDFIFIRDAARMIVRSFDKPARYRVYNIGSGQQTSLNEIIDDLKTVAGRDFTVEYTEAPKTFLKSTKISVSLFEDEFGADELTRLQDGLRQTVEAAR